MPCDIHGGVIAMCFIRNKPLGKATNLMDDILCAASARMSNMTMLTAALLRHMVLQSTRYLSQLAVQGLRICCEGATFARVQGKFRLIEVRVANCLWLCLHKQNVASCSAFGCKNIEHNLENDLIVCYAGVLACPEAIPQAAAFPTGSGCVYSSIPVQLLKAPVSTTGTATTSQLQLLY